MPSRNRRRSSATAHSMFLSKLCALTARVLPFLFRSVLALVVRRLFVFVFLVVFVGSFGRSCLFVGWLVGWPSPSCCCCASACLLGKFGVTARACLCRGCVSGFFSSCIRFQVAQANLSEISFCHRFLPSPLLLFSHSRWVILKFVCCVGSDPKTRLSGRVVVISRSKSSMTLRSFCRFVPWRVRSSNVGVCGGQLLLVFVFARLATAV